MRAFLVQTFIFIVLLTLSYSGYVYFRVQQQEKNAKTLQQVEQVRLQVFQEYHAVRNLGLIDAGNADNQMKIDKLIELLQKEPNLKNQEDKKVQELYEKYSEVIKKKKIFLTEYEKKKNFFEQEIKGLENEYIKLLDEFQQISKKLQ